MLGEFLDNDRINIGNIVENSPLIIFVWQNTAGWPVEYVTKNVEEVFGYSKEEFENDKITYQECIHPDDLERVNKEVTENSNSSTTFFEHKPYRIINKNGDIRWLKDKTIIKRDKLGTATQFQGSIFDVTLFIESKIEVEKQNGQLSKTKTLLARTQKIAKIGGWELINNSLNCTAEFCKILNIKTSTIPLSEFINLFQPTEKARLSKYFATIQDAHSNEVLQTFASVDDKIKWLRISRSVFDNDNNGVAGTLQDISQDHLFQEQIANEKEKMGQILSEMKTGLILFNDNHDILWSNNWIKKAFPSSQLPHAKCYKAIYGRNNVCPDCSLSKVFETGKSHSKEIYNDYVKKWFLCITHPIADENGKITEILESNVDITELKNAQKHEKELEEQLRQSQKMESLGMIAGSVAHDFNNLLTPIKGFAEMLINSTNKIDPNYKKLESIFKAAERARELTWQLLAFSRKQILKTKITNLNDILSDFRNILKRTIRENIELNIILQPDIPNIRAEEFQIEQIIINIAVNAQDAMPEGGILSIETRLVNLTHEFTELHPNQQTGQHILLSFTDNGIGMTKETLSQIFEPFFTTKPVNKGTGLGLATVFGIVKQHNANICAYSELGSGTSFKIYFPIVDEDVTSKEMAKAIENIENCTETILIAEDNEMVIELTSLMLNNMGYKTITALSPSECLAILAKEKVDLLLSDVIMPEMNGKELYKKALEIQKNLKVLYMSGYSDNIIFENGIKHSDATLLHKPFSTTELSNSIREALDKK